MDLLEILNKVANIGIPIGVIILLGLIKIPKLEINIWKWLGKIIGKAINDDVLKKIDKIEKKVDQIEKHDKEQDAERDEDNAEDARRRIITFADEIRLKIEHSEEMFNNVLDDITFYEKYCDTHTGFKNDKAKASIELVHKIYKECLEENKFL